jgi:BirA family biotin operon repressor/biotin-[acetyl-CoA-carboxylase] ligase
MKLHGTEVDFIVIGIGVNVNMALEEFNETFGVATSLKIELDRELPREDLTAKLLAGLEKWYLIFTGKGFTLIRDAWIALSDMMGRDVVVHSMDKVEKGRVAGLDEDGALLLSKEKGQMERIIAGDIILREG